ncbi:hemoglobin [Cryobacterium mesophilum]|nr:hemoglobin [Terrimesophilobacter mesophilus]
MSEEPSERSQPSPVTLRVGEGGAAAQGELFHAIGGSETFDLLVRRFYERVQTDPVLWPMYPQHDLEGAIHRLSSFLQQYWGGPTTYSQERGHPRLRARHAAFKVNPEARDHWLGHMRDALDTLDLSPLQHATFWGYLDRAAHSLVNTFAE